MSNGKKSNWTVRIRCEVTKTVCCTDCTEEEAWEHPWDHAGDAVEIDMADWVVVSVKDEGE